MDNFKVIYKILKYLERCMDFSERDLTPISPDTLGISRERWGELISMLLDNGYISGVTMRQYMDMDEPVIVSADHMKITLKGLEYLQENSAMKKVAATVKGIADIIH